MQKQGLDFPNIYKNMSIFFIQNFVGVADPELRIRKKKLLINSVKPFNKRKYNV